MLMTASRSLPVFIPLWLGPPVLGTPTLGVV
jgi:hypothetical protein